MNERYQTMTGTIYYTVDKQHPDYNCISEPEKEQSFSDIYRFDTYYYGRITIEQMKAYIKNDLRLVAGGGYDSEHIHKVRFEFS